MAVEFLTLATMPHLPWTARAALPPISAVYFVVGTPRRVLYIGSTNNLCARLRSHHHAAAFARMDGLQVAWHACAVKRMRQIELALISQVQPLLNYQKRPYRCVATFGMRLEHIRIGWGFTVTQAARRTALSELMIAWLEHKETPEQVGEEILHRLAVSYGVTLDYLSWEPEGARLVDIGRWLTPATPVEVGA